MSMINYGIGRIISEIPTRLLEKVFVANPTYNLNTVQSRESLIETQLIRRRVLIDCQTVSSTQVVLQLGHIIPTMINGADIYRLSMKDTNGRFITSALGIEYENGHSNIGTSMLAAVNGPVGTGSARIELLDAPNTIAVKENIKVGNLYLRCMLSNDVNMSNFGPRSYPLFGKICVMAAKAHIWTMLIDRIGEGGTTGGNTNAEIKTLVDSYADATELYNTMIEKRWKKMSMFNDRVTKDRAIVMGIGQR